MLFSNIRTITLVLLQYHGRFHLCHYIFLSGKNLEDLPILIADVNTEESLHEMCERARVVLNCVGPVSDWNQSLKVRSHRALALANANGNARIGTEAIDFAALALLLTLTDS